MKYVYHGSKEHNLKRLEPRKSTHGSYVYATKDKVLALHFSARCGDDLVYDIGHYDTDKSGPWELVENVPNALEKMYSNSSSIYILSSASFKNINTGFEEVVSEVTVDVINEEYYESVYDAIKELEEKGLIKIYRYPNKPLNFKKDGLNIFDKWRYYKNELNKDFKKYEFDRLFLLHPEYLDGINALSSEFGYDYHYTSEDLIEIFKDYSLLQLHDIDHEQYIDCAYISICNTFPNLKKKIDEIYLDYNNSLNNCESVVK